MSYITLIAVAVAGIMLGYLLARRRGKRGGGGGGKVTIDQSKVKYENKQKIIKFMQDNGNVRNNDIEELLGVSDATVTNYMDELERERKVEQVGSTGRAVHYILRK